MAKKYILDTHALVWYLEGNKRMGRQTKITMDAAVEQSDLDELDRKLHQ